MPKASIPQGGDKNDYAHEDVMQALVAAILFEENVALEATKKWQDSVREKAELPDVVTISPAPRSTLRISRAAMMLLVRANIEKQSLDTAIVSPHGFYHYDFTG